MNVEGSQQLHFVLTHLVDLIQRLFLAWLVVCSLLRLELVVVGLFSRHLGRDERSLGKV